MMLGGKKTPKEKERMMDSRENAPLTARCSSKPSSPIVEVLNCLRSNL
jgi:hypothetical protein